MVLPDLEAGAILEAVGGDTVEAGVEASILDEVVVGELVGAGQGRGAVAALKVVLGVAIIDVGREEPKATVEANGDGAGRGGGSSRRSLGLGRLSGAEDTGTKNGRGGQKELTHGVLQEMPAAPASFQAFVPTPGKRSNGWTHIAASGASPQSPGQGVSWQSWNTVTP